MHISLLVKWYVVLVVGSMNNIPPSPQTGHMAQCAYRVINQNRLSQRISIIPKHSSRLQVGADIRKPASVLISEIVDHGLLSEGILPTLQHARQEHLIADDAALLPRGARVFCCLADTHLEDLDGLSLKPLNTLRNYHYESKRVKQLAPCCYKRLSDVIEVFHFDFTKKDLPMEGKKEAEELSVDILYKGVATCIVFWYELDLDGEEKINTGPDSTITAWEQAVQFLPQNIPVQEHMRVPITARYDEFSIQLSVNHEILAAYHQAVPETPYQIKNYDKLMEAEQEINSKLTPQIMEQLREEMKKTSMDHLGDLFVWNLLHTLSKYAGDLFLDPTMVADFVSQFLYDDDGA